MYLSFKKNTILPLILFYLSISQVNVATKADLSGSSQPLWIPEAHLYSNPFFLLSIAANFTLSATRRVLCSSHPPHPHLHPITASDLRLGWTPSRPTQATPITPAAPGDQTDMGMFPACLPLHLMCLPRPLSPLLSPPCLYLSTPPFWLF